MSDAKDGILTYRGAVYPWHCDHMGHMNIACYVAKLDEANWSLFHAIGLTPSYLRANPVGMAGVQRNISYKQELFPGDVVEVHSRVLEVRDKVVRLEHVMRNVETGEVAAVCELTAVHLDKTAHKALAFPPAVRAAAEALLATGR
jgi:acyl-CoA thioester hydrolase